MWWKINRWSFSTGTGVKNGRCGHQLLNVLAQNLIFWPKTFVWNRSPIFIFTSSEHFHPSLTPHVDSNLPKCFVILFMVFNFSFLVYPIATFATVKVSHQCKYYCLSLYTLYYNNPLQWFSPQKIHHYIYNIPHIMCLWHFMT